MKLGLVAFPLYRSLLLDAALSETPLLDAALANEGAALQLIDGFAQTDEVLQLDAMLMLGCWGYHNDPQQYLRYIDWLEASGVAVINPAELLRWNMDKRYLLDLQRQGVSVAPLRHHPQHARLDLDHEVRQAGYVRYVLKPTVSANAQKTRVCHGPPDAEACALADEILQHSGLIIQPYFDALVTSGELSFLFFGGRFSHAVCKVPKPGDFRSQPSFGAHLAPFAPSPELLRQAAQTIAAVPSAHTLPYARVDGFVQDGQLQLVELELIEPFLFLRSTPDPARAAQRFAQSVVAAVSAKK